MKLRSFYTIGGVRLDRASNTFEDVEVGEDEFVGFVGAESGEQGLGLLAEGGVVGLQHVFDDLNQLCGVVHVEIKLLMPQQTN